MSGFTFERHSRYCALKFTPEFSDMSWERVEEATARVTELVGNGHSQAVLVDMSALEKMPTGMVASLVRIWKAAGDGGSRFVVVSANEAMANDLKQSGLASLWTLTSSLDDAYRVFGVTAPTDVDIDEVPPTSPAAKSAMAPAAAPPERVVSNEPFIFEEQKAYCSIQMNPVLMSLGWDEVERATTEVIEKCRSARHMNVLVDVGAMEIINSALVASLVRIWKASKEANGQFSLVSPNDVVTDVLKSAGLWKLWSVVDDREEAVYHLGVSRGAQAEKRERQVLVLVALPCAAVALLSVILMFMKREDSLGVNAQLMALLLASAAIATGGISAFKDTGTPRKLSSGAVLTGLFVLSSLWFRENPISFGRALPERRFSESTSDPVSPQPDTRRQDLGEPEKKESPKVSDTPSEEKDSQPTRAFTRKIPEDLNI